VTYNLTKTRRIATMWNQNVEKHESSNSREHLKCKQNIDSRCVCPCLGKVIQGDDERKKL